MCQNYLVVMNSRFMIYGDFSMTFLHLWCSYLSRCDNKTRCFSRVSLNRLRDILAQHSHCTNASCVWWQSHNVKTPLTFTKGLSINTVCTHDTFYVWNVWEERTWVNGKVARLGIRVKVWLNSSSAAVSSVLSFPQTTHCSPSVFRATYYFTASIIGHAVCYSAMTLQHIYLKMMNSVVSSRLSGAARPGCPPPLYPPTEVAWRHGSVCARFQLKPSR